jgi:hypothetical protein
MSVIPYNFENSVVEFELAHGNVMVNATQMAKIFDKQVVAFLRNDQTKAFIEECLKSENSHFLNVKSEEDLVQSKQRSGTFMHRVLALKFAAWLDPKFELWVYATIDRLLFADYHQLRENIKMAAIRKNDIEQLREELRADERFARLERMELEDRQSSVQRGKFNKNQLSLFRSLEKSPNAAAN